jgi:hypothetical protein
MENLPVSEFGEPEVRLDGRWYWFDYRSRTSPRYAVNVFVNMYGGVEVSFGEE